MIWNYGQLPENWTIDTLQEKHSSVPYNPDISNAFFRIGYIEAWGRGIRKMNEQCAKAGLPNPLYYYASRLGVDVAQLGILASLNFQLRSEERRVGKECRSRWSPYH